MIIIVLEVQVRNIKRHKKNVLVLWLGSGVVRTIAHDNGTTSSSLQDVSALLENWSQTGKFFHMEYNINTILMYYNPSGAKAVSFWKEKVSL